MAWAFSCRFSLAAWLLRNAAVCVMRSLVLFIARVLQLLLRQRRIRSSKYTSGSFSEILRKECWTSLLLMRLLMLLHWLLLFGVGVGGWRCSSCRFIFEHT